MVQDHELLDWDLPVLSPLGEVFPEAITQVLVGLLRFLPVCLEPATVRLLMYIVTMRNTQSV